MQDKKLSNDTKENPDDDDLENDFFFINVEIDALWKTKWLNNRNQHIFLSFTVQCIEGNLYIYTGIQEFRGSLW